MVGLSGRFWTRLRGVLGVVSSSQREVAGGGRGVSGENEGEACEATCPEAAEASLQYLTKLRFLTERSKVYLKKNVTEHDRSGWHDGD